MRLTESQIKTAAKWWADQLRNPSFDNGDRSIAGAMATVMASRLASDPAEDAAKEFEMTLNCLLTMISKEDGYVDLSVDYHPSKTLYDALEIAGVKVGMTALPWKTWMRFDNGGVQVAKGYGAALAELEMV